MKKFLKTLLINSLISFVLLFLLLFLFFFMGSGSAGFNKKWFYLIFVVGLLHSLICAYKLRSEEKYYLLIPLLIFVIYIYFYFN